MAEKGIWWRSCYACSGKLYELTTGLLFCSNEHCMRGGRVMSFDETIDKAGSTHSLCILEECYSHSKGRYENDGIRNGETRELAIQSSSKNGARQIRLRRKTKDGDRV